MTPDQTTALINEAALPIATFGLAAFSYVCLHGAAWLKAKTKSELIAQVVGSAGRVAGDISDQLAALPAGSNVAAIRETAIQVGIADVKNRVPDAVKKTGVTDSALAGIVAGELGKLNALKHPVFAPPILMTK